MNGVPQRQGRYRRFTGSLRWRGRSRYAPGSGTRGHEGPAVGALADWKPKQDRAERRRLTVHGRGKPKKQRTAATRVRRRPRAALWFWKRVRADKVAATPVKIRRPR